MFPTNIRELTRIIESFKDYIVGTALNISCHAAKDPKEPSAKRSWKKLEIGRWRTHGVYPWQSRPIVHAARHMRLQQCP